MPDPSDSTVRETARAILERSEYRVDELPWWFDGLRWFVEKLRAFEMLRSTEPALYWLVVAGLGLLLVLLVAHIVWAISRALRTPDEPGASRPTLATRDFVDESRVLAAEGRALEASHRLLLASLERVASRRVIDLRPEHTNRAVRRALLASSLPRDLVASLDALIRRTEASWFRDRLDDPGLYEAWQEVYRRLGEVTAP